MSKLTWDGVGKKEYQYGVSQGVLFKLDSTDNKWKGVAWSGLTNVTDSPEGGDVEEKYADNILYASVRGVEKFGGSIECFTFPDEWLGCIGKKEIMDGVTIGQQNRDTFCLAYRTEIGNDQNQHAGYKINIVYNSTANASEMSHDTTEESVDFEPMSFDFDSNTVPVTGHKATSKLEFSSLTTNAKAMTALTNLIYGTDNKDSELLMPDDLFDLLEAAIAAQ